MSVQLASEIWNLMRESVPYDDREQLADSLIGILLDNGYDLDDIRYEFNDDADVQEAIKFYADDIESEDSDYDEEENDNEEW